MFAGKKSAQIREILINESAWEEMTCLFAPSLVKIKLTFSDTYQVTFSRVRGAMVKEVSTFDNVYCDQLECLFNEQTGLATRL